MDLRQKRGCSLSDTGSCFDRRIVSRRVKASTFVLLALVSMVFVGSACRGAGRDAANRELPNIVVILADDMGYGDPGSYNPASRIPTPNIDRLAGEGMRFTDAHSPSAVCTPTRYGLLTGRYAWRTRLKSGVLVGYSSALIEEGRLTLASLLQHSGYATAAVGKWHLGLGSVEPTDYEQPLRPGPNAVGFDYFFGIPASLDMAPYVYVENEALVEPPTDSVEASVERRQGGNGFWRAGPIAPGFRHIDVVPALTGEAVDFIQRQQGSGSPFFLYLPFSAPHTPWLPTEEFAGRSGAGPYGDFAVQVDSAIGSVLGALVSTSVVDDTLVIVTSDNGAHWLESDIQQHGHRANGELRGQKADIWEGGHRVPFIASWPGRIAAGSSSDETITHTDLLATVADIVGATLPPGAGEDSYSVLPALLGEPLDAPLREATVHHSHRGLFAIRQGPWKLILGLGSGGFTEPISVEPAVGEPPGQLYNLDEDPGEATDLYATHPDVVARLGALLEKYRQSGRSAPIAPDERTQTGESGVSSDELYAVFKEPPPEARPFARWWWNGDCVEIDELERELDVMKAAGIGGVEINPIAKPEGGDPFDYQCYEWLSREWNERVKATVEMAKQRSMVVDLIMGSGWPFGGEFLQEDQLLQGVGIRKMELEGPQTLSLDLEEEWQLPGRDFGAYANPDAPDPELFFLQMIPHGARGETSLVDLTGRVDGDGTLEFAVPEGKHDLYIGTLQRAYRTVTLGAPGSKGPVVDHYDAGDVRAYMDRLADALEAVLGGKLGDHIRAIFCDSIELSGANITDDFLEEFLQRRGYDLQPFIPLVYYPPSAGYADTLHYEAEFNADIRRVRYDFNKTLVELFLERFTATFDGWANEHGLQSRYQAYGNPWLVGMLDGYRLVDIPESNNWLFSPVPDAKRHGYWIWNKYTASAAHLTGARVVSSEAMTNTRGVFRATLDMVKKNDDFNFISGITHSVLHGYNYSPPEAGFPGWVRFGAYFSDQNTWWPYFRNWADYNARLSALLQHSSPVLDVAILTPEADIWKQSGLYRIPFYMEPPYNHDLWEGFSKVGVMADYINEGVIQRASADAGEMVSEEARYKLVVVSEATSIEPETAAAIHDLAAQGINFLFIDRLPSEAPSYFQKETNDQAVRAAMSAASELENVVVRSPPADAGPITAWTEQVSEEFDLRTRVSVAPVNETVYTLKHQSGEREIYFLSNQDDLESHELRLTYASTDKTAWRWDPESGERSIYPTRDRGVLDIRLEALESILIVLDDSDDGPAADLVYPDEGSGVQIDSEWLLEFEPFREDPFEVATARLFGFGGHEDHRIASFAGNVEYHTTFELSEADWTFLDLGRERHVSAVTLNGYEIGLKWWGRHLYRLPEGILRVGDNELEISYTTTLANYTNSLTDNEVAQRWTNLQRPDPMGLTNDVRLLK